MKNKKTTYLLLVCVAAVWGVIFYRLAVNMGGDETPAATKSDGGIKLQYQLTDHTNDLFVVHAGYRDPFTGIENMPVAAVARKETSAPKPMPKPVESINWDAIIYTGFIQNPSTKQNITLLRYNGQDLMLAVGQQANGIKVLKQQKDSVLLSFKNKTKYISIRK